MITCHLQVLNGSLVTYVNMKYEHVVVNQVVEDVNPSVEVGLIFVVRLRNRTFPSTKASPGCI